MNSDLDDDNVDCEQRGQDHDYDNVRWEKDGGMMRDLRACIECGHSYWTEWYDAKKYADGERANAGMDAYHDND